MRAQEEGLRREPEERPAYLAGGLDSRMVHGDDNGDDDGEDVNPSPSYEAQHVNIKCNTLVFPAWSVD